MWTRPESDEALIRRLLPSTNTSLADRNLAWAEWQMSTGEAALQKYIRMHNNSGELDDDILQETLLTAYLGVESGRYQPQPSIPFIAYAKGIARNKIREARRRERYWIDLEEIPSSPAGPQHRLVEAFIEQREQQEALEQGLAQLPTQRRKVLESYLQGASTGEIASSLEISEALVRQHKSRGLRKLRQMTFSASLPLTAALDRASTSDGI